MSIDDDDEPDCPCCCCLSKETTDKLYVFTVLCIMIFGLISYWYLVVIPFAWYSSLKGIINLICLHGAYCMMLFCYRKAITTCAGFVPLNWRPVDASFEELEFAKTEQSQNSDRYFDPSTFYRPRWCKYCDSYKPARSYHCRDLNRCVLKLDHYCPWVYNAVGWKNHKYFFLFLFYASSSLFYHIFCVIISAYYMMTEFQQSPSDFEVSIPHLTMFVLQLILVLPVTLAIFSLFIYQLTCMMDGQTSIEVMHCNRYTKYLKHRGYKFNWFYRFGRIENMKLVLGYEIKYWFLPIIPSHTLKVGSGISFKTRVYPPLPPYEYKKETKAEIEMRKKNESDESSTSEDK